LRFGFVESQVSFPDSDFCQRLRLVSASVAWVPVVEHGSAEKTELVLEGLGPTDSATIEVVSAMCSRWSVSSDRAASEIDEKCILFPWMRT
jgi:hypothetical protein